MAIQLRCDGDLYGVLSDDHLTLEVKCKRRRCGAGPGVIVLHVISLAEGQAGKVIQTRRFAEPLRKENNGNR